ncbi:PaaI family thioesterase [Paracoccaceae bacterium]|nr:PaaI family thioesterase [Paracoccaceae bacterium]
MSQKKLRNNPFQHFVGIEVVHLGDGKSVLQLELKDHHFNLYGIPHGGVHATLLDIAMGTAASFPDNSGLEIDSVTLNISVDYIAPPATKTLIARGKVTKRGKSIAYCTAEILDNDKTLVATGRSIFKLYDREGKKD